MYGASNHIERMGPADATAMRRPQLVEQLDELEKQVERLAAVTGSLNERLQPYMTPKPDPAEPSRGGPEASMCPAAERVRELARRVGLSSYGIESMLRNLEI